MMDVGTYYKESGIVVNNDRCYTSHLLRSMSGITGRGEMDEKVNKKTESSLCDAFSDAMSKSHFRLYSKEVIMGYDGYKYVSLPDSILESMIVAVLKALNVGGVYYVNSVPTILKHCKRVIASKEYNPKKNLISVRNGVVDLDSKGGIKLLPHSHELEPCTHINIDYDPNAKCDSFRTFLTEVLPDEDVKKVVQEFIGCMFVDRKKYKMEKVMYFIGNGRNGKGVLSDLIKEIAGEENHTVFSMKELLKDGNKAYNLATADGKLLNLCSDMSNDDISGGEFKTYVSGEPVMARHIFGAPFMAKCPPILMASMNQLPVVTDHSKGQMDRPIIVPFDRYFSDDEQDRTLGDRLSLELSGFFNWIVEGRQRFVANRGHFTNSSIIENEKVKARIESNSLTRYLHEMHYEPTKQSYNIQDDITLKAIYNSYRSYCQESGFSSFSQNNVGRFLSSEGYKKWRTADGMKYTFYRRNVFTKESGFVPLDGEVKVEDKISELPF